METILHHNKMRLFFGAIVALLWYPLPARAEVVTLICNFGGWDWVHDFDLQQGTVTENSPDGRQQTYVATVTPREIRWQRSPNNFHRLDRRTLMITGNSEYSQAQCRKADGAGI